MTVGHTDKATINQRRPLTSNMRILLTSLVYRADHGRSFPKCMFPNELSQAEKNAAKALHDRGLIWWDIDLLGWRIADAGRSALSSHQLAPQGE